jgi:hypothetical protein
MTFSRVCYASCIFNLRLLVSCILRGSRQVTRAREPARFCTMRSAALRIHACPIEIEGKVLEDELSRGDERDGHRTVDNRGEDLDDGFGDGVGEDLSQVSFLLLGQRVRA